MNITADLDSATDEELVSLYQGGDAAAVDALMTRYRSFARMKSRS